MKTQITGRNVTITDALQQYANEKIEHVHKLLLQRKIDEVTRVELELQVEKNPSIPEPCIAEATVFTRGPVIRARESSTDMYAAIDLVSDKLVRRVKKYHDRAHGKTRHGHDKLALPVEPDAELAPVAAVVVVAVVVVSVDVMVLRSWFERSGFSSCRDWECRSRCHQRRSRGS